MQKALQIVLPLIFLVAGAFAARTLATNRPAPPKKERTERPALVRVVAVDGAPQRAVVEALGTVTPDRRVVVQPEVAGRVVEIHPDLAPGARLAAGEVLVRVDPRDYELAVAQAKAQLVRARFELELEEGRAAAAKREWEVMGRRGGGGATTKRGRRLALREPHGKAARAAVAAAKSAVELAGLRLERATVRVPFDAIVASEQVEVGQLVGPQAPIATLLGAARFRV